MDWQAIIVSVIVVGAALYVARHLLASLGIFRFRGRRSAPSCAAGCGQCGADEENKR